jgi:hypothetical protein
MTVIMPPRCATCEFWTGNRITNGRAVQCNSSSDKGNCLNKFKSKYTTFMANQPCCQYYEKWSQLK